MSARHMSPIMFWRDFEARGDEATAQRLAKSGEDGACDRSGVVRIAPGDVTSTKIFGEGRNL